MSALVRALVAAQPDPPRSVALGELMAAAYRNGTALKIAGFGVVLGGAAVGVGVIAQGDWIWKGLIVVVGGALLLICVAGPAMLAARARRAVARGLRVTAEVISVDWADKDGSTIDALSNGMARGTRRVNHPVNAFTDVFESDASWAADLRPGSIMLVLVDPLRARVWFDLGPAQATDSALDR
jgi:hypothetical protein